MDTSRMPSGKTWSASQVDELRKFLQTASQVPSANSIQEALRPEAPQPHQLLRGRSTAGTSESPQAGTSHLTGSTMMLPVPDGYSGVKYPTPDVNSMIFDIGSGCRFDQCTGLYYNANSGLFINKQLNVLLKWNSAESTYKLVGRASNIATPPLAQDLARLVRHTPIAVVPSVQAAALDPKPSVTSPTLHTVGDAPFRRERSLDFEEMSPEPEETVFQSRSRQGEEQSPERYFPERRRSLSFDEMTPERDLDEIMPVTVFPRGSRSPSPSVRPRIDSSSPRRRDMDRYSPVGRSPDRRHNRSSRSRIRDNSRSPSLPPYYSRYSKDHGDVRRERDGRSPSPTVQTGWRRNAYRGRGETSKYSQRSRSRSPSTTNRNSLRWSRSRSPTLNRSSLGWSRSSSPSIAKRNYPRRSRSRSPSAVNRNYPRRSRSSSPTLNRSRPRWSRSRSPSVANRKYPRQSRSRSPTLNRNYPRRSRSRSPTLTRNNPRQSRSRSPSNLNKRDCRRSPSRSKANYESRSEDHSRRSMSLLREKKPLVDLAVPTKSDLHGGSCSTDHTSHSNDEPPEVETSTVAAVPPGENCFSRRFMAENVRRIQKANLRNPKNKYGRLLPPQRRRTNFIMLTPLPPKGDRDWEDLEILIQGMLEVEQVNNVSVTVYPGDGGAPCNYCLIHFKNPDDAFRWYVVHEGTIDLSGPDGSTCTIFMNFIQNNWKCGQCKEQNFALRNFCYKCFWFKTNTKKPPFQTSQLVTEYVGVAGLDCRFLSIEDILAGLPPLDSFNIDTLEIVVEPSGIPLGLCVFGFKDQQESAAFYRVLQESCVNPVFVKYHDRKGLDINRVRWDSLKTVGNPNVVPKEDLPNVIDLPVVAKVVFPNPPESDTNDPLLWWCHVEGYTEGGDIMKYLFEKHPTVNIAYDSAPAQVMIGPIPLPVACDLMEYRNLLSRHLQRTGVEPKSADNTSICRAHHFGAPYNFSFVRFGTKLQSKTWFEKNEGKLVLHLENGSTWTAHLHYSKPNWQCSTCNKLNFPIRIQCFSCYKPRLSDHTGVNMKKTPTNSVGITGYQNWCATPELLFKKLPFLSTIQNLTVSYLREPTGVPLGICVLKSATPGASEVLFKKLEDALTNEIARSSVQDPNRPLLVFVV